jgi:hypothetical protein
MELLKNKKRKFQLHFSKNKYEEVGERDVPQLARHLMSFPALGVKGLKLHKPVGKTLWLRWNTGACLGRDEFRGRRWRKVMPLSDGFGRNSRIWKYINLDPWDEIIKVMYSARYTSVTISSKSWGHGMVVYLKKIRISYILWMWGQG